MRIWLVLLLLLGVAAIGPASAAQERGAFTITPTDSDGRYTLYTRSHALVIGIDDYSNGWPRLSNAVNDAKAVAAELEQRGFGVHLVIDPDSDTLRQAIEQFVFESGSDPQARLFIWFAGHGHTVDGEGYLVPAGAPGPDEGWRFRKAALSLRSFGRYMREVRSKHVLAVFDSCFAGTIFNTARSRPSPTIDLATTQPVRQFVSSGEAEQTVSDDGTFRKLFIDALNGLEPNADANRDGYVTGSELGLFLSDKVTTLTNGTQTPRYGKLNALKLDRGDFVFSIVRDRPRVKSTDPSKSAPPAAPGATPDESAWKAIQDTDSEAVLRAFIDEFPNSIYAKFARARLAEMQRAAKAPDPADTEPDEEAPFIGALDGTYAGDKVSFRIDADAGRESVTFSAGNCSVTGKLDQREDHWVVVATGTDGICAFLREISTNEEIARIFPTPRQMANSGRVLAFQVQHIAYALNDFSGSYALE